MKTSSIALALVLGVAAGASFLAFGSDTAQPSVATQRTAGLPDQFRAAFCGDRAGTPKERSASHELSGDYSRALLAEIRRREVESRQTTQEALASMAQEYCNANGASQ